MKKLFYIILIVIGLVLIGKAVKNKDFSSQESAFEQTEALPEENIDPITGEIIEENAIIETISFDDNADGMIIEDTSEEVIEENPELTAEDDETIVAE